MLSPVNNLSSRRGTRRSLFPPPVTALAALALLLLPACSRQSPDTAATLATAAPEQISFNQHIRPILVENCHACHGGVKKAGEVSFIYQEEALGYGESGKRVITPGQPEASELFRRITSADPEVRMPPADHGDALSPEQIGNIEKWIRQGAQWEEHWAYQLPQPPKLPTTADTSWPRNDIDRFTLAKMEEQGLQPNPPQDPARLLRRLSLDLIGLPPTVEEMKAFLSDDSANAYAKQVDRLLASPCFGERWATPWLDLARYGDSKGFERDQHRDIWAYRDWVIQVLNDDLPFDQFTIAQIAGDLVSEPALDDLIATGFHRNTKTNLEGGTDDEEYRVAAVLDRVNTTWQAFMGTSFGCVQCHSHPYDPLPHESYYQFAAYFNNTADHDTREDYPRIKYAHDPTQRDLLYEKQLELSRVLQDYHRPFHQLSLATDWSPLTYSEATSTRGVVIHLESDEQGREVLQTGPNTPKGAVHTIVTQPPAPNHPGIDAPQNGKSTSNSQPSYREPGKENSGAPAISRLTALRIDALMQKGKSVANPGDPFIVTHIELRLLTKDGQTETICLGRAFSDEAEPYNWPQDSLDPQKRSGWSAYPKQHYPRWVVFLPKHPVDLPPEAQLQIVLRHEAGHDGAQQPVLRRFRLSIDDSPKWTELNHSPATAELLAQRQTLLEEIEATEGTRMPIMQERSDDFARVTNLFIRGDWLNKGERVQPEIPPVFRQAADQEIADRLELARWMVSPENPLTARFAVNRFWQQLFGRGIVFTLEDFGSAGQPPSHPELIDYLALRFQNELGWSVKALLREIVLSATYQQSAIASREKRQADPENIYLSYGPRLRLTAEMIRDNALRASGLLSDKMFGPSVMPPQPDGVWRTARNRQEWENAEGEDRYRRAVYTYWKRSSPYPSFLTFDASTRELCDPRRTPTNTPLQALVTLNDPVYVECAENLAALSMAHGGEQPEDWIRHAYKRALLAPPSEPDLASLLKLYQQAHAEYPSNDDTPPEQYAMTLVASALLNLDAFLTK